VTYTGAALLGVAGALAVDLLVLRTQLIARAVFWATYPIVIVFQLLSNGILTGRRIVIYDPAAILGWRIAYAPVEDLLFGFAMVLLTLSLWVWWGRRGVDRTPRAGEGSAVLARLRRHQQANRAATNKHDPEAVSRASDRAAGGGVG
jgi:lycopene cyclase domain-containing protein